MCKLTSDAFSSLPIRVSSKNDPGIVELGVTLEGIYFSNLSFNP